LEFNIPFQHKYGYIRDEGIRSKNWRTDGGGLLIGPDGVVPNWIVGASASSYPPYQHKVQKKLSSGTGSPGWSQKRGHKMVVVVLLHWWLQGRWQFGLLANVSHKLLYIQRR